MGIDGFMKNILETFIFKSVCGNQNIMEMYLLHTNSQWKVKETHSVWFS